MGVFDEAGQEVREDAQSLFICLNGMNPEEGLRLPAITPSLASSQHWAPMLPLNLPFLRELLTICDRPKGLLSVSQWTEGNSFEL